MDCDCCHSGEGLTAELTGLSGVAIGVLMTCGEACHRAGFGSLQSRNTGVARSSKLRRHVGAEGFASALSRARHVCVTAARIGNVLDELLRSGSELGSTAISAISLGAQAAAILHTRRSRCDASSGRAGCDRGRRHCASRCRRGSLRGRRACRGRTSAASSTRARRAIAATGEHDQRKSKSD
jgi:hypothetical protein